MKIIVNTAEPLPDFAIPNITGFKIAKEGNSIFRNVILGFSKITKKRKQER